MAPQRKLEDALDTLIGINNAQTGAQTGSVGAMHRVGVINSPDAPAKPSQTPRQFIAPESTVLRLELSASQRAELTQAIQKHFYQLLQTHYDAYRNGRKFSDLPVGEQTALLSLSWQQGSIWSPKNPAYAVFKEALKENWHAVTDQLRDGPLARNSRRSDAARRRAEAELIDAATKAPAP
jgi:hypothetical protein